MKYAVELYTLRDDIKTGEGLLAIFPKIKALGYDGVEFAGFYGLDAKTIKKGLDDAGLVCVGTHTSLASFLPDKIDETIEFHKTLGTEYIGIGGAPHSTDADAEKIDLIFAWANKYGKEKGVKFYYHTHYSEFTALESGRLPIDVIKNGAYLQIDTYWSHYAGINTREFLLQNSDKLVTLHIKDGVGGGPRALGEGDNDLKTVVKTAEELGFEWLIVENDNPTPNGLADIERSMKYLRDNDLI